MSRRFFFNSYRIKRWVCLHSLLCQKHPSPMDTWPKGKKKNKTWHLAVLSESMSIWSLKSTHQSTGLCACCSRYGDLSLANLLECLWEVDDGPSLPDAILMKTDGLDTQDAYECGSWFLLAKQSNLDVAASVWAQIQWLNTLHNVKPAPGCHCVTLE